jgi:hypothetical protein
VAVESSFSFLTVEIDGLPHIHLDRTRLLGVVAHREGKDGKWRIHFALRGAATWTTYDDVELWRVVTAKLAKHLPGGLVRLGPARVWVDTDKRVGLTSWGVKAERRYYVEFALEGSEYLRVPYEGRAAWMTALRALKEASL